jgi:hypothetical protein
MRLTRDYLARVRAEWSESSSDEVGLSKREKRERARNSHLLANVRTPLLRASTEREIRELAL